MTRKGFESADDQDSQPAGTEAEGAGAAGPPIAVMVPPIRVPAMSGVALAESEGES